MSSAGEISGARVSVVTICRNNLAGVQATARSLCELTLPPSEWVVIDGASSDGSVEWLQAKSPRPPDRLVSEPDRGISDALNKGITHACGDAILFMNAGDRFHSPRALEQILKLWNRSLYRWVIAGCDIVNTAGALLSRRRPQPNDQLLFPENRICHAAVIADRSLFIEFGLFRCDFELAMDYEMWLRWLSHGVVPHVLPDALADFATGGASGASAKRYRELMRARAQHKFPATWTREMRGLAVAHVKELCGGLRQWPLLYRAKEALRL